MSTKPGAAQIDVFVSSDARSIPPGDAWLKAVDTNLDKAAALIVLASPASVARPWITFEAGAGWAKRVPTMLVCHSGMVPGDLPLPLGQLQAFKIDDEKRLKAMYAVIADVMGSASPEVDLAPFTTAAAGFEARYTEERDVLIALRAIAKESKHLIEAFQKMPANSRFDIGGTPEALVRRVETNLNALQGRGLLQWHFGVVMMSFAGPGQAGGGNAGDLSVTLSPQVVAALKRPEFR